MDSITQDCRTIDFLPDRHPQKCDRDHAATIPKPTAIANRDRAGVFAHSHQVGSSMPSLSSPEGYSGEKGCPFSRQVAKMPRRENRKP
ncbi:hypothetical protein [Ferrimonas balearica]|uniref:hypothetical protein n=1 Tax=Ferrimonas balearica TaxID=44012 RepID=UPI001C975B19|nr:hypothetical protein [Ferrimonas balearica]MBY5981390.1 hypothetical protein [Ferrimonas balearica]